MGYSDETKDRKLNMIVSGADLRTMCREGVLTNVADKLFNGGSIDIECGRYYIKEAKISFLRRILIRLGLAKYPEKSLLDKTNGRVMEIPASGIVLKPGESILLESRQMFNLPEGSEDSESKPIFAEYKLKSTMARNFVDAYNAGWCDAGWNNARLTIELRNCNRWHSIRITEGMRIGQMIFMRGTRAVDKELSYRTKGRYNNTIIVTGAL